MVDPREGLVYNENWRSYAAIKGHITDEVCERILAMRGEVKPGEIQKSEAGKSYRDSDISWIRYDKNTAWLFRMIKPIVVKANERFYKFKLTGFTEPFQFTEYGPDQHYDWHIDIGTGELSIRKLSFILQLTDPAEYDGGALQIASNRKPRSLIRDRGSVIVFPSFVLHRVTPVTRGIRNSLVGWIGGPPFS